MVNKIDKKYYGVIWVALVISCFAKNVCDIYNFARGAKNVGLYEAVLNFATDIIVPTIVPIVLAALLPLLLWGIGFRRHVLPISRKDFAYSTMAFTAAAKFVADLVFAFCILEPNMGYVISPFLEFLLLTSAYLVMFFVFFEKLYKFNPIEKYNAFKFLAMAYMIAAGVLIVAEGFSELLLAGMSSIGGAFGEEIYAILEQYNLVGIVNNKFVTAGNATAFAVYGAFLVFVIVAGEMMKKKAREFRDPMSRDGYYATHSTLAYTMRSDTHSTFAEEFTDTGTVGDATSPEDEQKPKEESVFDEFDI